MLKFTNFGDITRIDSARTLAGRGYYWSTAYLVDGLLIDTGCAHSAYELAAIIKQENLRFIINTHTHEDHIGANGILQARQGDLNIFAHPIALPILENPHRTQPLQMYRRIMWGWPKPSSGRSVNDGEWIETDKYRFRVIYTPGHSPDHLCLYEPNRGWFFSGDLFVGGRDRALRDGYNIWQIIESLKRVGKIPLKTLFPGCARVRDNPTLALTNKIEYLQETGEKILLLHKKGVSRGAIARSVFGGPMWIEFMTLGHFTRRHLVESYLNPENRGDSKLSVLL